MCADYSPLVASGVLTRARGDRAAAIVLFSNLPRCQRFLFSNLPRCQRARRWWLTAPGIDDGAD